MNDILVALAALMPALIILAYIFFRDKNSSKMAIFADFIQKQVYLSTILAILAEVDVKTKTPYTTTSCGIWCILEYPNTKSWFCSKNSKTKIRHFLQNFVKIFVIQVHFYSADSASKFLPSSLSLCSCALAADALRKRTRDCFTSSRAAWIASSVRPITSSAYSLAT